MTDSRSRRKSHAAGIIQRHDNHVLIVAPRNDQGPDRMWQFPRGPVNSGESPEAAMRRVAARQLGLKVKILVGQPPFVCKLGPEKAEIRYFVCSVSSGEAKAGPYAEIRWVLRGQLCEYEFDQASRPVVEWLGKRGGK